MDIRGSKDTGFLCLSNSFGLVIKVNDSGDGVLYQYTDQAEAMEAEIQYKTIGVNDDSEATFVTAGGSLYFLSDFIRSV